MLTLGDVEI